MCRKEKQAWAVGRKINSVDRNLNEKKEKPAVHCSAACKKKRKEVLLLFCLSVQWWIKSEERSKKKNNRRTRLEGNRHYCTTVNSVKKSAAGTANKKKCGESRKRKQKDARECERWRRRRRIGAAAAAAGTFVALTRIGTQHHIINQLAHYTATATVCDCTSAAPPMTDVSKCDRVKWISLRSQCFGRCPAWSLVAVGTSITRSKPAEQIRWAQACFCICRNNNNNVIGQKESVDERQRKRTERNMKYSPRCYWCCCWTDMSEY